MIDYIRTARTALSGALLAAALASSPAGAGVYSWQNPGGGAWNVSGNWSIPGYPTLFFDFAIFNLPGACSVDAADSLRIGPVGGILVAAGETRLSAYEGFGGALSLSPDGSGGALILTRGSIITAGVHTVGPGGVLSLASGTSLQSRSTGAFGVDVQAGGTLRGDGGSIDRQVLRNLGTVSPGLLRGSTGVLLVGSRQAAGYVQGAGGALEIDVAGSLPKSRHDQLRVVDGSLGVALGGKLRVSLSDAFVPAPGDRFEILVAPSYTGAFAEVDLPEVPGRTFTLLYETGGVSLVVEGEAQVTVALDVQPGNCANSLGAGKQGVLPAAILGTPDMRAGDVDPISVRLEGVAPLRWHLEDVGGPAADAGCPDSSPDGRLALVLHLSAPDVLAAAGPVSAGEEVALRLTGALRDGTPITGEDRVSIRGNARQEKSAGLSGTPAGVKIWPAVRPRDAVQRASYALPEAAIVRLEVFDVTGELVARLVDAAQPAGAYTVEWRPLGRPGGVYFYRLTAGKEVRTARIVLDH